MSALWTFAGWLFTAVWALCMLCAARICEDVMFACAVM